MMVLLMAAIIGGMAAFFALWSFGVIVALVGACFGGSLVAAIVGWLLAHPMRRQEDKKSAKPGNASSEKHIIQGQDRP